MDGGEATRQIRALPDPALAKIPILAMTANAFEEDRKSALECGMNGFLSKPINIEELIAALSSLLAGQARFFPSFRLAMTSAEQAAWPKLSIKVVDSPRR